MVHHREATFSYASTAFGMIHLTELALAGLSVGMLVGMTGMGGGALMTPLLMLGFGINPTIAVGSDLAVSLVVKPVGAVVHHRAGTVRWELVRLLVPTAVPGAFAGAWLVSLVGEHHDIDSLLRWAVGAALLAGVAGMGVQAVLARRRELPGAAFIPDHELHLKPAATLVVGLIGGLVVGFTSIGSGSLIMVLLMVLHPRLRASDLVGTDLVQAIPMVGAAALGHAVFGDVQLALTTALLVGAIPGTAIGATFATRVPDRAIRCALIVVLSASAATLLGFPVALSLVVAAVSGSLLWRFSPPAKPARPVSPRGETDGDGHALLVADDSMPSLPGSP